VLDTAALLADDRITASLSKDALALVTNDLARPYQPRRTERLFIPYYGMLAYARHGAWEEAAVEARRVSGLLAQYANDRDDAERSLHAALHHLAGAVFERAGNRGEAEVAYRAAHALSLAHRDSLNATASAGEGELLVVVERGFVAHRATATIDLWLGDEDRDSLRHSEESRRRAVSRIAKSVGTWSTGGSANRSDALRVGPPFGSRHSRRDDDDEDNDGHYLSIAFPALRRSARPWKGAVHLAVDDRPVRGGEVQLAAAVDDASAADERRERVALATRAIARAATKYVVTKAIKDKKGDVAGTIAELGASILERADVRSWHLLPQEITLLRLRLPAGAREVRLLVGGGQHAQVVDVGRVTILAGTVTIAPIRLWGDPPASSTRATESVVATVDTGCSSLHCP
jgi:hypothetical protein